MCKLRWKLHTLGADVSRHRLRLINGAGSTGQRLADCGVIKHVRASVSSCADARCALLAAERVHPFPCTTMAPTTAPMRGLARFILGIASCLLALSCSGSKDSTSSTRVRPPAQLYIVSGDAQSGTVGKEIAQPLVVKVVDANGRPIEGQLVNFRVTAGGGSVFAGSATTNPDGIAQERWTLGTVAGADQTLEARAVDNSTGQAIVFATFHATAIADVPSALAILTQPSATAQSGQSLAVQPVVRVTDRYGNPASSSGVQVTATIAAPANGQTLTGAATVASDNSGSATFTNLAIVGTIGSVALSFSSNGLTPVVSRAISLGAGSPTQLTAVTSTSLTGTVGVALATLPRVVVRDVTGNPVAGVTITFALSTDGGTISPTSVTTDANGEAALSNWVLPTKTGTVMVVASASAIPNASVTFSVMAQPGPAVQIAWVSGNSMSVVAGSSPVALVTLVTDSYGNLVPGATVSWTITSGQATLSANSSLSDASGKTTIAVAPTTPGTVQVAAALANGGSVVFTLTVSTPIYTLSITLDGTGSGTVTSVPAGISCTLSAGAATGQCSAQFTTGTKVTLSAVQATGSVFSQWSGACTGTSNCDLTIDQSLAANATFTALPMGVLTIQGVGTGQGTVNSSPTGLACAIDSGSTSGSCSHSFVNGTTVTLTATSDSKSRFDGWSGDCTGTGQCVLSMTQNHNVSASFTRLTYTLTVAGTGTGSGVVMTSPAYGACLYTAGTTTSPCNFEIPAGTSIQVYAGYVATGSSFSGFSGDCSGNCTMNANHSVTATFTRVSYTLTLQLYATGSGTVTSNTGMKCQDAGGGISGSVSNLVICTSQIAIGTSVTLTAIADPGSAFSGLGCSSAPSCTYTFTMNADVTLSGNFQRLYYPVTVIGNGAGSGTVTGGTGISYGGLIDCSIIAGTTSGICAAGISRGQNMNLMATPAAGSVFAGWGGACAGAGTQTTCGTGVDTSGVTVTASFALAATLTITGTVPPSGQSFTVRSLDGKVSCTITTSGNSGQCTATYATSSSVSLTFTRSATSLSMQWSSDGPNECNGSLAASASGTGSCTLTMSGNRTVTVSQ